MEYIVYIDGYTFNGTPVDQTLVSISNLQNGHHRVTLIANPPHPSSDATLLFESAIVTVGTGLTG